MCGIAGFIAEEIGLVPEKTIAQMRSSIIYRGRDDQGEWNDGQHAHFLHTRLSIIDLATGQQPMWDTSGRYVIIFNGEIYNYKELRQEYAKRGAHFRTQSDTEVILEGFKLKGAKVCNDLNGMFAFAIWDCQDKRLFLARDHLGKKPLYWCSYGGVFYFASTLDAFRAIPGWNARLSSSSIVLFALLGNFPEDTTIYQNASAIPYASYCFVKPGQIDVSCERYWRMDFSSKSAHKLGDLIDQYECLLTNAIAIRLRSDVPLALTYSGGVDSGTIAALCAKKLNTTLHCYTIDYHTPNDPSEETINAERAAKHLSLPWHYIHFDYHHDLLADLQDTYQYYDQPSNQLPLVYSQRLYEAIKPYATVVLSGNGADELFTGYIGDEKKRQRDLVLRSLRWIRPLLGLPLSLAQKHSDLGKKDFFRKALYAALPVPLAFTESFLKQASLIDNNPDTVAAVKRVFTKMASEATKSGIDSMLDFSMFLALVCSTSDSNYRLPDISGLATQVEVRSPYLDYRMVEYAACLPHRFKVGNLFSPTHNKYLPKKYYENMVPPDIAWSRKKGMGSNLRWDRNIIQDSRFEKAFRDAYTVLDQNGIETKRFRSAWNQYRAGEQQNGGLMMSGFMLGNWILRTTAPSRI